MHEALKATAASPALERPYTFLTLQPDRGGVVRRLTAEGVSELFEIRAALEALAVQLSAPRVEATFLADSEEILNRMDRARGDISLWIKRHEEFHERLAAPCSRPRLAAQARPYRQMVEPYVRFYVTTHHDPEMEGAEHWIRSSRSPRWTLPAAHSAAETLRRRPSYGSEGWSPLAAGCSRGVSVPVDRRFIRAVASAMLPEGLLSSSRPRPGTGRQGRLYGRCS